MSARTRRSLTLTWTALFVLSLLLQYFTFAAAPPALAAHDVGIFELDGNADDQATAGADWENGPEGALDAFFVGAASEAEANDTTYFTTGGSKDENDIPAWEITDTGAPDKNELLDAYAAVYQSAGDTWVYFGADRFDNDGTAQIGFWFFQDDIGIAAGDFTGEHVDGDVLIISEYTNGGVVSTICAYVWDGSGGGDNIANAAGCDEATNNSNLNLVAAGAQCDVSEGQFEICARTNDDVENAPWTFLNKDDETDFGEGQFFEGGINLSDMFGGDAPCFGAFLAETRTSAETDAQLKDFALGDFNTCVPPTITTTSSVSTADFGQQVTDSATFTGSNGAVTGTATFFICTPTQVTAAGCPEGSGAQVGAVKTIAAGAATSDAYTVGLTAAAAGKYCWRVEYDPAEGSDYLAASHTNATTECFTVAPATIDVTKTANPAGPVSAGGVIGFDITVSNTGTTTTLGVSLSDPLPAGVDWTAGAPTGSTTGLTCAITGPVGTEVLNCTKPSLAAGASFSIHISGTTDSADCGTVSNTASVSTTNDGSDTATATVVVQCPDVTVAKTPDGGSVNAGGTATFTIVVTNLGPGAATGVTLTDNLPAGYTWSVGGANAADCSINSVPNPDVLTCNFGTLADDATRTITLSALTSGANCANIPNLAVVDATNEPESANGNNSDPGDIEVLCAEIDIEKTANPVGPVNAGDDIGFDITVTNNGDGTASDVHVSDPLPDGFDWVLGAVTGDTTGVSCQITGSPPNGEALTCDDASMAPDDTFTVHISATTDAADCGGEITNVADVTTGNDGEDSDDASVVVQCPDVTVLKTADTGIVSAGEPVGFTITVSNAGPGTANDVHVEDNLPGGVAWEIDPAVAGCEIVGSTLTCDFDSVAVNQPIAIHVVGVSDEADCGTLLNTVTVSASNEPESATGNNSAEAEVVVLCPDVTVVKTADASPINAGETAGFTITITNIGPGTAYDVHVEDVLPAGVDWTIDGPDQGCVITSGTLTCDFSQMIDDEVRAIHITGVTDPADCGTLPNTVNVSATNEPDSATGNNSSTAEIVVNCPDVTVEKTAGPDISAGENATFAITVTNLGPGTATDVVLDDTLPVGVAWSVAAAFKNGSPISNPCDPIAAGVLHCDLGDLLVDDAVVIHIGGETDFDDCPSLHNEVTVGASNEPEENTNNNDDEADVVVNCPELGIVKSADHEVPVLIGNQIGFEITVANNGEGTAFNVSVSDTLDPDFTWSIQSQSGDLLWELAGNVLTASGDLGAGETSTVHVVASTSVENSESQCGEVPNTAVLSQTVGESTNPVDEDSASEAVRCPELTIDKSAFNGEIQIDPVTGAPAATIGDTISYTLEYTLVDGPVTNGSITDVIPLGLEYVDGTATNNEEFTFQDAVVNGDGTTTLTWTADEVTDSAPPNTALAYDVTVTALTEVLEQPFVNVATIDSDQTPPDDDDQPVTVNTPEINEIVPNGVCVGNIPFFQYSFDLVNLPGGDLTITFINPDGPDVVFDDLPAGVVDGDVVHFEGEVLWPGAVLDSEGNIVDWPGWTLLPDGTWVEGDEFSWVRPSVQVRFEINPEATITVDYPAATSECADPPPDLGIVKTNNAPLTTIETTEGPVELPTANEGDTVTYTLTYNTNGIPQTNGVLTDVLPEGVTYVEDSATDSDNGEFTFIGYDDATRTLRWEAEDVTEGGVVTYQATIDEGAAELEQPLINVATIVTDQQPPDDDNSPVFVPPVPLELTPPPTDTLAPSATAGNPGFALMLVLLAIAGLALTIGFVTPVPESVRRRDRLG